eukprot:5072450-Amphidinium_carterae.1
MRCRAQGAHLATWKRKGRAPGIKSSNIAGHTAAHGACQRGGQPVATSPEPEAMCKHFCGRGVQNLLLLLLASQYGAQGLAGISTEPNSDNSSAFR